MIKRLFATKNQKLVRRWKKEHGNMVTLAHKIISAYKHHNYKAVRKELKRLNHVAMEHLMTEDLEFFELLQNSARVDNNTKKMVDEFNLSFRDTKAVLRGFFATYTHSNAIYDEEFFTTFGAIVEALGNRIAYEEKNLYVKLDESRRVVNQKIR